MLMSTAKFSRFKMSIDEGFLHWEKTKKEENTLCAGHGAVTWALFLFPNYIYFVLDY